MITFGVIASFTLLIIGQLIIKLLLFNSLESVYSMGENQIKYKNPQCALHAKRKGKTFGQPRSVPRSLPQERDLGIN
jgi:hypothetical protein